MSVKNLKYSKLKIGIVGAGPAGAMAAYLLSQAGHDVEVLERKKLVQRKVCGEYLCPKGVELLEKLDLLDQLTYDFYPLYGMVLTSPQNDIITTYFPKSSKEQKGLSLNRELFDQRIVELAQQSGAKILFDKAITHATFLPDQKQWAIKTDDNEEFRYDLLIAADGRQSKIGHLLGHIEKINTDRVALHCYLPKKIDQNLRLGEMHILSGGSYCGLDPINEQTTNFSIVCNSALLKTSNAHTIINHTIKGSKRLGQLFDPITQDQEIRIVTTLKNKNAFIAGNHLAYIGDAAGFIDPLTGEGIYNALFSAHILNEALAKNENIEAALFQYKKQKKLLSFQKNLINHFFQFLIKKPFLIHLTVNFLNKSPARANHFIGIVGNIHSPLIGIIKMLKA